jgi:sarcosine oxidase subunit gamma
MLTPHRHGLAEGAPGVIARERTGLSLATLIARRGMAGVLRERMAARFAVDLIDGPRASSGEGLTCIGMGPAKWLVVLEPDSLVAVDDLADMMAGVAAVIDQTDGHGLLRLSGPRLRDTFAKLVPLDLDPAVFRPGHAATTLAHHIGVTLWQVDGTPTFDVAVFRSMAEAFRHALEQSAAQYGLDLQA